MGEVCHGRNAADMNERASAACRGRNRRGVISGNTATQLTFAGHGWTVAAGERYVIVESGAVYEFARIPDPIYQWCGSPKELWLTHNPEDDQITTTALPYYAASLPGYVGGLVTIFDNDVWTEIADENDIPDKCYTPHVFKTIRGLQIAIEMLCNWFVEPVDHSGRNALENFNVATFFECLGINTASATITSVDIENGKTHFSPGIAGKFRADLADARRAWLESHGNAQERSEAARDTFLAYVDEAGRYADFYSLRHTFISNLAAGGVNPKTAKELARHSTISLTMDRYSHLLKGEAAAALDVLPDLSGPAQPAQAMAATGTDGTAKTPDPRLARFLALSRRKHGDERSQGRRATGGETRGSDIQNCAEMPGKPQDLTEKPGSDRLPDVARRGGRVAEGDGLLNRYTGSFPYPGFESLPLR